MVTDPADGTPSRTGPRPQSPAKPGDVHSASIARASNHITHSHQHHPPIRLNHGPGTSPHAPTPSAHQAHRAPSAISEQTPLPIIEVSEMCPARVAGSSRLEHCSSPGAVQGRTPHPAVVRTCGIGKAADPVLLRHVEPKFRAPRAVDGPDSPGNHPPAPRAS